LINGIARTADRACEIWYLATDSTLLLRARVVPAWFLCPDLPVACEFAVVDVIDGGTA
jgi:hypothetical protein